MSITEQQVNDNAANGVDKGRTYGSVDKGIEVLKYRNKRLNYWLLKGNCFFDANVKADNDVKSQFGQPKPL